MCQFSHPGLGIHTLQELSLLKGEDMDTVLTTIRNNTTHLYGIWSSQRWIEARSKEKPFLGAGFVCKCFILDSLLTCGRLSLTVWDERDPAHHCFTLYDIVLQILKPMHSGFKHLFNLNFLCCVLIIWYPSHCSDMSGCLFCQTGVLFCFISWSIKDFETLIYSTGMFLLKILGTVQLKSIWISKNNLIYHWCKHVQTLFFTEMRRLGD